MSEQVLRDLEQYEAALSQPRVLLFKHSPVCPISTAARAEYEIFKTDHPDAPTMFVNVVSERRVARGIAERCGVQHESPQVILFEEGRPVCGNCRRNSRNRSSGGAPSTGIPLTRKLGVPRTPS